MPGASLIRKQIGAAVWMLTLFAQLTPADWVGDTSAYIAGGKALTDAELAAWLETSRRVVATWRRRLPKLD